MPHEYVVVAHTIKICPITYPARHFEMILMGKYFPAAFAHLVKFLLKVATITFPELSSIKLMFSQGHKCTDSDFIKSNELTSSCSCYGAKIDRYMQMAWFISFLHN